MNNIHGIGIDLEEIPRIEAALARWSDAFKRKVFTDAEIAYCDGRPKPAQHYAARFAAKEAVGKAIGTGWAGHFRWKDVEIVNDASGKPGARLHGELGERFRGMHLHVSISHSASHVTAMVVIEHAESFIHPGG